jgi:hypothetical protein
MPKTPARAARSIRRARPSVSRLGNGHTVLGVPTEHVEQREFVAWFRREFPTVRILAVPNGGYRGKVTAQRMKLEGVEPGVPDLFVPGWALWIEMKRQKGGSVSMEQKDWMMYLQRVGYTCWVAKGCDDAKRQVLEFYNAMSKNS